MTQMVLTVGDTTRTVNCTYDGFNRLHKFSDNSGEAVYTYDADGLRSSKTTSAGTEYYVYDNGQLVAKIAEPIEPIEPIFDGSIPDSGEKTTSLSLKTGRWYYGEINGVLYNVQAEDYIIQVELYARPIEDDERPEIPVGTVIYTRLVMGDVCFMTDPDTGETTITGPAGTRAILYDSNPNVEQLDDASYVRGLNLIASVTDGQATYYHYNAHGDVVQTTDATGAVLHDYSYDAFGVERNADDTDANPFRYSGEQFDAETGNYYLRARTYSPTTGRFTQEDPIRDGLNWYAYCAGNPVRFVDSSGCIIELSEEATDDQRQQYYQAVEYIKSCEKGKELIGMLEDSKTIFCIKFNSENRDAFVRRVNIIRWDPHSALILSDKMRVQSPALGLAHEMGHAAQYLNGQMTDEYRFDEEEADNLTRWETPIATELNEYTRLNYDDIAGKYKRTTNSTDRGVLWPPFASYSNLLRPFVACSTRHPFGRLFSLSLHVFEQEFYYLKPLQNENRWIPES